MSVLWCKERVLFDSIVEIGAQFGAVGLGVVLVLCSFGFPMAKSLVIVFGGVLAGMERGNAVILFLACSLLTKIASLFLASSLHSL